jgi:very-short-patch-repair endonuclease
MRNAWANPNSSFNKKSCRDKISKNTTKQWKNITIRKKMIKGVKKSWTKERCNKMRGDNNPAKSLQARNKISQKLSGKKKPKWLIEKLAEMHRGKPVKKTTIEKIRRTQLEKSDEYRERKILFHRLHPEKHPNYILSKNRNNMKKSTEKIMYNILLDLNLKFNTDFFFNYYIPSYWLDFAIPSLKLDIETDGEHWHQDKEKDLLRTNYLNKLGWKVLRFTDKELKNSLDVKNRLDEIILKRGDERLMR